MKPADFIVKLGAQLEAERVAAHDLWTWLPSYKVAQKHHGDYASEHAPSVADVMTEAAMYFSRLAHPDVPLTPEERRWFENCSCGEDHMPEEQGDPIVDAKPTSKRRKR